MGTDLVNRLADYWEIVLQLEVVEMNIDLMNTVVVLGTVVVVAVGSLDIVVLDKVVVLGMLLVAVGSLDIVVLG